MESKQRHQPKWQIPFFTIWTGQQLSLIGSSLAQFALVWWLTETTGSATVLAMGTLISMLPQVFMGPFAGALVDRWNRRVVMLVADSAIALVSAWLAYLFWADAIQVWHVYVIMFARAIGGIFHWPSMMASTSLMVPEKHLPRVAGLNQTIQGALNIISPPLGAFLLGVLPPHAIMGIDVLTAAFAIAPLFFVHIPQPERSVAKGEAQVGIVRSVWQDVREGLRYVSSWPGLSALLAMAAFTNLLGTPAFTLVPILVTKHFGGGVLQLGWMNSAYGVGFVLGGLILGMWGGFRRRIVTMLMGWLGMSVGILMIGLSPTTAFWMGLVGFFIAGLMNPIGNGTAMALLQAVVAPEMQGRVFTLVISLSSAMAPLGMAIAGPVADKFGVRTWYLIGSVLPMLVFVGAFFVPAIMHLEDNHNGHAVAEAETLVPATAPVRAETE